MPHPPRTPNPHPIRIPLFQPARPQVTSIGIGACGVFAQPDVKPSSRLCINLFRWHPTSITPRFPHITIFLLARAVPQVTSIGIGARGELLAVGGESPTLELYAAATGQLLRTLVLQAQTASLCLSRDGALMAVGTASSVKLFTVRWGGPDSTEVPHASKTLELPQGVSSGMVRRALDACPSYSPHPLPVQVRRA
jgi:hypothetical protein